MASGANADDVAKYRTHAERRVKAFASFVNIAGMSEHQVNAMIASSSAGKTTACTLLYGPKMVGGEPHGAAHPHFRLSTRTVHAPWWVASRAAAQRLDT